MGLIPFWAKDAKIGFTTINGKAEAVAEKPAFREAYRSRRCLVPADGFYEWAKLPDGAKQPYAIVMKDRSLFGFAGLWERWTDKESGEVVRTFTIITTAPNEVCVPIHVDCNHEPRIVVLDVPDPLVDLEARHPLRWEWPHQPQQMHRVDRLLAEPLAVVLWRDDRGHAVDGAA